MIFEFIITYVQRKDLVIDDVLRVRLRDALEANLNDVDEETLRPMVTATFERTLPRAADGKQTTILVFSLALPDETASIREALDDFCDALVADPITHAVKCEDPLLRAELVARGEELYFLEMKLRRVLSVIYLHAYPDADPYDLLSEEVVQPMAKDRPQMEQMKTASENQFFHLTFGQYINLNQRAATKDLALLIRNEETYEAFRAELLRQPVEDEDDAGFLSGLRERLDSIEKMRNAVAHNRRPSKKVTNDYLNALPLVSKALDEYLSGLVDDWRDSLGGGEMLWDAATRREIERVMENAIWNRESRTITLCSGHDDQNKATTSNRDELITYLENVTQEVFYAHCPQEDGEPIFRCDYRAIVDEVLEKYEMQLSTLFGPDDKTVPD